MAVTITPPVLVSVSRTIFVDTGGLDATGAIGRPDLPFLTISAANIAATASSPTSSSPVAIVVRPGTFNESSSISLSANVSLYGSGIGVTNIVGTSAQFGGISTHKAGVCPGSGSVVSDLTIDASVSSASMPLGCGTSDTAFTSCFIYRVKLVGQSDGFYFENTSCTGLIAYDCLVSNTGNQASDCAITLAGVTGTFEFYNCEFVSNVSGITSRGVTVNAGTIRVFGGRISTTGSSGANRPLTCIGGTLEARNIRINRDATGTDMVQTGGTLYYDDITRDDGAALTTSGTVTNLENIVDAQAGFTIARAAATGKILIGDGTKFLASTPTFPTAASTTGKIVQSDGTNLVMSTATWPTNVTAGYNVLANGTNYVAYPTGIRNSSTAAVAGGYAADTYLDGSSVTIAAGDWKVKGQYYCMFDMTKTAAGIATPIITIRMGTLGTTSDAAILTLTFAAGTAVIDSGTFHVYVNFRTVGSGTSAVIAGVAQCHHQSANGLTTTGGQNGMITGTSSGFASTTQTIMGISFNGGASFAGTNTLVQAELRQP
jgi:hypothetical protein